MYNNALRMASEKERHTKKEKENCATVHCTKTTQNSKHFQQEPWLSKAKADNAGLIGKRGRVGTAEMPLYLT